MDGERARWLPDVGLLVLRLGVAGLMIARHGLPKLLEFGTKSQTFSDPLGVGSATSLSLAIFAELFCAIAVALGLATRLAAVPLVFTMLVAGFVVHADDPFNKTEFALLFAIPFFALILTGPGRLSVDHAIRRWWSGRRHQVMESGSNQTGVRSPGVSASAAGGGNEERTA